MSIESLDRHPQQPHIVAVGRGDGSVCFIDLRQPKYHTQVVRAHSDHGKSMRCEDFQRFLEQGFIRFLYETLLSENWPFQILMQCARYLWPGTAIGSCVWGDPCDNEC